MALAIRAVVLLSLVNIVGAKALKQPWSHLHPGWVVVVAVGVILTYPAYFVAYRSIVRSGRALKVDTGIIARIVVAGFGPIAISGGFGYDLQALSELNDPVVARTKVAALSSLEWAVLGPINFVIAVILLVGDPAIPASLLWPTAIGVPVVGLAVVWAAAPRRITKMSEPFGRRVNFIAFSLEGIASVRDMARHAPRFPGAWVGMVCYWAADICAFWAAARLVDLHLDLGGVILAYTSGYQVSRRSLPLGGAGLAEALLVYALYGVGATLGASLNAVLIYRAFDFFAAIVPSLIAHRDLRSARRRRESSGALYASGATAPEVD